MNSKNSQILDEYKIEVTEALEKKIPGLLDDFEQISKNFESGFTEELKSELKEAFTTIEELKGFNISVVIDNNFIFGQIKSMVSNKVDLEESFIFKLINSVFISVHAPLKLREELYKKIDLYLGANIDRAKELADLLTSKINLMDAYWIDDWKKANNQIGGIDQDDVPYLALAIHLKSHAIISLDKVFQWQRETGVWTIGDTDKILTSFNRGTFSFTLLGLGGITIYTIYQVIALVLKTLFEILKDIFTALFELLASILKLITKVPPSLWALVLGVLLYKIYSSEEFRTKGLEFFDKIKDSFKQYIEDLVHDLTHFKNQLLELWDLFKPIGVTSGQIILYLTMEITSMIDDLNRISINAPTSIPLLPSPNKNT